MRVTLKSIRIVGHIVYGLLLAVLAGIAPRRFPRERLAVAWHRRLLAILGIEVIARGLPIARTGVIVANHVSWLDIPVLGSAAPVRFVSKAEIADWPVAGWLADAAGTFYLRRGAGGTRHLAAQLRAHLGGGVVVFFPEGTTTDGRKLLRFQPRLFSTALETGHPVQPVALRFSPAADGTATAPFVGDDDLFSHLMRLLRHGPLRVELIGCAPIDPQGHDRDSLAEAAFAAICAEVAPDQLAEGRVISRRQAQAELAPSKPAARRGWLRAMR